MRSARLVWIMALLLSLADSASGTPANTNGTFRNHVQPVLAKFGCSSGACHGAAAGQNGFRLSLRGYDDEGDYLSLTRHALGRRIVPSDPGRSLLLLKPTGSVPHKGGKRFDVDSLEYNVLAAWIAAGAPGPQPTDPRIERLEVEPGQTLLKPGASQPLTVRAHFSDGHAEDVTRWAKYTSANESVANVGEDGTVTVLGNGEGAITAWYLSRIAVATVTVPYTNPVPPAPFAETPLRNCIDQLVLEKLQRLNLPPSPRCSDAEFIRRAFLDTIGTLPTAQEVRRFLEDNHDAPLTPLRGENSPSQGARFEPQNHGAPPLPALSPAQSGGEGGRPVAPKRSEGGRPGEGEVHGKGSRTPSEATVSKRDRLIDTLLDRPSHEKPFLLLVVGYPETDAVVPDIHRKPLAHIVTWR